MTEKFLYSFVFGVLLTSAACTPKVSAISTRWNGAGARPDISADEFELSSTSSVTSKNEKIRFQKQYIDSFAIDETFVKTIENKKNEVVFQSTSLVPSIPPKLLEHATKLREKSTQIWAQFLKKNPKYKNAKIETTSEVVFVQEPTYRPVLRTHIESSNGQIVATELNQNGKLLSETVVGSKLAEATEAAALAYPRGPKHSGLSKIEVWRVPGLDGLSNDKVSVTSEAPLKITSDYDLQSPPPDDRFDQVQAYFYANEILDWFAKSGIMKESLQLKINTHIGYPEKTNTAFYFRKEIRLGEGDT
ncbi:MAG: hypothetical protein EOP06_08895, partial [Proteobacteria bacterium]